MKFDLDVVPPPTEEPVTLPGEGELTVSSPVLLLPSPGVEGGERGGEEDGDQPAVSGSG